jgi:hypothetical protein
MPDLKLTEPVAPKDIFKMVLDTRNLEVGLFWQRSNYFLILNTAIAVAFFRLEPTAYAPFVAFVGLVVCLFWYRVTLGGKFWQVRWERKLREIETLYAESGQFDKRLRLFLLTYEEVREEVQDELRRSSHGWYARLQDSQILAKPSVTSTMISLAFFFGSCWGGLFVASMLRQ